MEKRKPEPDRIAPVTRQQITTDIYKSSGKVGGVVTDLWRVQINWDTLFSGAVSNPSWQFTLIPVPFKLGKLVWANYFLTGNVVAGGLIVWPFASYLSIPLNLNGMERLAPTIGGASPAGTTLNTTGFVPLRFQRSRETIGLPQEGIDFRITGPRLENVQVNWVGDTGTPIGNASPGSLFAIGDGVAGNIDLRFEILDL